MKSVRTIWLFAFVILTASSLHSAQEPLQKLSTYFQYDQNEISELSKKNSTEKMSKEELIKWDEIAADLSAKNPASNVYCLYAYLYTAQKDAAFLSYNSHGQFIGSMGPLSAKVLQLFFPSVQLVTSDEYSDYLSTIIFAKIKARFDDERANMKSSPMDENDPMLKDLPKPYIGLKIASCKPWLLVDPTQFTAPKPPAQNDPYWVQQSEIVKQIAENATEEQIQKTKFWAKEAGPKSGDWMAIADDYMFSHDVPFSKIVCVRAILAQAGVDVDIAIFNTKYTYAIKRPSTVNPTIKQHIPFPKHPSYPSGHSTWSPACATILSYYFPNEKDHWFKLAEEAGQSRIWGGIHYPIDHKNGWNLGVQLGEAILQSPKLCY
jgi:membrane-associated phospholipid phosphatase